MDRTERLRQAALDTAADAASRVAHAQGDLDAAVARALHWGASWTQIGDVIGVTRQSAHRRYRHHRWDPGSQTAWSEPPLPL